jgi:hypothetical protein
MNPVEDINLQNEDYLVNFDVSLFTNAPVEEVLEATRNTLSTDPSLPQRASLQLKT